jgi:hypothetical protein
VVSQKQDGGVASADMLAGVAGGEPHGAPTLGREGPVLALPMSRPRHRGP